MRGWAVTSQINKALKFESATADREERCKKKGLFLRKMNKEIEVIEHMFGRRDAAADSDRKRVE